ncbi:hypothetical protein ACLI1A_14810 [Flavobacterium sp. RHBU_3]|uniref:hypothetical protein n=1 Tax=Flavobacterium sp. RHBU_3 TaxID=3391184 RepID=UPI003984A931
MKYKCINIIIFICISLGAIAQETISIPKIKADKNLKVYEYPKVYALGGVISDMPYTFLINYKKESVSITFTTISGQEEIWTDKPISDDEFIKYLQGEYSALMKKVHLPELFKKILDKEITIKNYDLNKKTGRLAVIGNNSEYEEVSLEVQHIGYYSYVYTILIRWKY